MRLKPEVIFNHDPIVKAENMSQDYTKRTDLTYKVVEGSDKAFYRRSDNTVCVPALAQYENYDQESVKTSEENSLSYLRGWIKPLRDDVTMIVKASAQAQRAADLILNVSYPKEEDIVA